MDKIMRISRGCLLSLLLFGFLTGVGALLLKFTPFPESWNFYWLLTSMSAVCFFAGLYSGGTLQKAGILTGISISVFILMVILIIVCACFSTFPDSGVLRPAYLIPLAAGALGGIFGTNIKK